MDKAEEFMRQYKNMKSDFMKTYLSDSKISSDEAEAEYEYISGNEEDDHSVDSIPPEYLFQKDSSDSSSDSESDKESSYFKMMPSKSFYSSRCDGTAKAIPVSAKELQEREKKIRIEETKAREEEEERSRSIQTFKYWKLFKEVPVQRSDDEIDIAQFYRDLHEKWLPNFHLTQPSRIYHYLEKAGSDTCCHLIPADMMGMILTQPQLPYEWQLLLREMFPKTFNPHTRQMNGELYYRYIDDMIKEYEKDDVDEEFMKRYVLLNVLLSLFMFSREILYIVHLTRQSIKIDVTQEIPIEDNNKIISQYGYDYKILFKMGLWLSESYENEIYPHIYDIYQMAILMSS
jgi:hypothetical protein